MNGSVNIICSGDAIHLPAVAMEEVNLSLHGANRFLERDIPLEAVEGVRHLLPLLNEKPLTFRYKGVLVVARLVNGSPRIITAWKVPPSA
ncbi:hypothetical protein KI811_16155 [Geobacter hydrogenophilus]|uniref:Uncharacterized protein n=1 Tax=Geobacter hydrogenophilus TaxID=40983 RepID=A0A9W6LDB4_9BACT|nr:hypothetical protein [Geobacter hydrogenophilus]MBT0895341.1 hypothetical protein [Geobacter hydrogenophilus]GLI39568.1 hypothetical protein GHYDROH2_30690 [Geobacter hydrogenophilus]